MIAAAAAALLAIALAAGWYWGSLWRMREAALAGDLERMAAYIDYETINAEERRNSRMWLRSILDSTSAETETGRNFRAFAERGLAVPDSEIGVDPEELRRWLAEIPIHFAGLGTAPSPYRYRPYLVRYGLDGFEVRDEGMDWEMGSLLTFRREGLGWRLVGARWGQQ